MKRISPELRERLLWYTVQQVFMAVCCLWGSFVFKLIAGCLAVPVMLTWWLVMVLLGFPTSLEPEYGSYFAAGWHLLNYWYTALALFLVFGDIPNILKRSNPDERP